MIYAKLLDDLIYKSGKSLQQISEECTKLGENITTSYLSKLRNNKMPAPSFKKTIVICKVLNVEPEKLLAASVKDTTESSKGELRIALEEIYPDADAGEIFEKSLGILFGYNDFINPPYIPSEAELSEINEIYGVKQTMVDLPILGTIRAGIPIDRIENHEGTYPAFKRDVNGYEAFWLKVQGESMSGDEIHDGDMVCVIMTTDVNPSDISVVAVNGNEATLKRVKILDGKCVLTPSNRNMEPMIYPAKDIHIIGKVVSLQRSFK